MSTSNKTTATDTSTCSTSNISASEKKKRESASQREKKAAQLRLFAYRNIENVLQDDVTVAGRPFAFRPRKCVLPFLRVTRRLGLSVNGVLNEALVFYFNAQAKDGGLRDDVRLAQLCGEELKLVRLNKLMLRSGAYLDGYAEKVLKGGAEREDVKLGRKALAALAKDEEPIFKRMIAKREAIIREVLEILDRQLPKDEYVLKGEEGFQEHVKKSKSRRARRDSNHFKGGEKQQW